jgi:hypothetical protein
MFTLILILLMSGSLPQRVDIAQVGTQPQTNTPIMGCSPGYVLWRADIDTVPVNTDSGVTRKAQTKWHISSEQTLLGNIHLRKHHECWLSGVVPEAK